MAGPRPPRPDFAPARRCNLNKRETGWRNLPELRVRPVSQGGRDLGVARGRGRGADPSVPLGRSWAARRGPTQRAPERPHEALVSSTRPQQHLLADRPALKALGGGGAGAR